MGVHWSIKLGIAVFIGMVFGWIFFPVHTLNEWEQFLWDISVFIAGVALIWFWLWRMQVIKDRAAAEEEEFKEHVLCGIDNSKAKKLQSEAEELREELQRRIRIELYGSRRTNKEMRDNAEQALSQDQQAHLRMLRDNPSFKIVSNNIVNLSGDGVISPENKIDVKA